jgi:hypothetical protein
VQIHLLRGRRVQGAEDQVPQVRRARRPRQGRRGAAADGRHPSPAGCPQSRAAAFSRRRAGEFVRQNESKQNTWIIGGLIGLFAASLSILGIFVNVPLLAVTPVGVALSILAVWLWLRKKKLEAKARGTAKTEVTPKI